MKILFGILFLMVLNLSAADDPQMADVQNVNGDIAYNQQKFLLIQDIKEQTVQQSDQERKKKSGFKAVLFSAVIPGAGEFYAESYWKSAVFAALEVAGWISYVHYDNEGDRKDRIMRSLGDDRWSEQRYWSRVYQIAVETDAWDHQPISLDNTTGVIVDDEYTAQNISRLRALETTTNMPTYYTHSLPETKTQQYYEMIYKYLRQFGSGWVELQEMGLPISYYEGGASSNTPDVARYKKIRNESNNLYAIASTVGTVILANHLISALDAALSVKSYNGAIQYSLYGSHQYYAGEYVNTYGIALSW